MPRSTMTGICTNRTRTDAPMLHRHQCVHRHRLRLDLVVAGLVVAEVVQEHRARLAALRPRHQRADARSRRLATVRKGCPSKKSEMSWRDRIASACCGGPWGGANLSHRLAKSEISWTRARREICWRRGSLARLRIASCIRGRRQGSYSYQDLKNLLRMFRKAVIPSFLPNAVIIVNPS
jgi:hypothetical protein